MRKNNNADITVIIPAYNEEKGIGPTIAEIHQVLEDPRYLVVDGNSMDKTVEIAKQMGADVFIQKGKGKGRAIAQVLEHVNSDTKYVVFIDADFTYPAKPILQMIDILEKSPRVGMITGNRFEKRFVLKKAMTDVMYFGNRTLAFIQRLLNGVDLRDPLTGLRVVRWCILKNWRPKSCGFDVEAELNHFVKKRGYKLREVPIDYRRRLGEKKLGVRHSILILKRILLESLAP